ncbi:hypothetical protein [Nocardia sp. bgisy118]|uniref:hypothetical protein n=1 Tax=Nocardia sp. bgisy118 TaxID=3413786 RepID=UPI003F4A3EED
MSVWRVVPVRVRVLWWCCCSGWFRGFDRSHLFTLVDSIELEPVTAERAVADAVEFVRAVRNRRGDWIGETVVLERDGVKSVVRVDVDSFASELWRKVLRDKRRPRMSRRHLAVCVFSYLAAELRSGDIAVAGSDSYANLHAQLMSWDECAPLVEQFCAQAGMPSEASELHSLTWPASAVLRETSPASFRLDMTTRLDLNREREAYPQAS